MIVKIQMPLGGSDLTQALAYNRSREIQGFIPITDEIIATMEGEPKKFFEANYTVGGQIEIDFDREVTNQGW